ncbi:MAG: acyclic terpene utilization AtuA family protein [Acetobacterales bacterium]
MDDGPRNRSLRTLNPNGHLGFAPIKTGSFHRGVAESPDLLAADSGSNDIGPVPLAIDISSSPREWQEHDLEEMLVAARRLGVPLIIGSAGDTGANSRVDAFVDMVKALAKKHGLPKFRLGYFYSELTGTELRRRLDAGEIIEGLDGRAPLTTADIDATDRIVAMADIHPFIDLLDKGADVIIAGRSSDSAIFAAPAIRQGYPPALAYYYGKVLECASFCAEPYAGK